MKPPPKHLEIHIRKSATKISFPDLKFQFTCFLPFCLPEFCDGFALPCDGECSMLQNYVNWIGTNSGKWRFRLGSLKMCNSWWYCDEGGRDPVLFIKCTRQSSDHSALENQSIWTYWLNNHKQTLKPNIKANQKLSCLISFSSFALVLSGLLMKKSIPLEMPRNYVKALGLYHSHGPTSKATTMYHTVDGRNPANQLRLVVYPIIYKVLAPSQVVQDFFHQQYFHYSFSHNHGSGKRLFFTGNDILLEGHIFHWTMIIGEG